MTVMIDEKIKKGPAASGEKTLCFSSLDEITSLVQRFEDLTLTRPEWTHSAHLLIAFWYLTHHPGQEAARLIRARIKRLNAAHGVKTTRTRGYHETITLFWIWAVSKYLLLAGDGRPLVETANGLLEHYSDKRLPFAYYSAERLMSWEARTGWVEPDLKLFD